MYYLSQEIKTLQDIIDAEGLSQVKSPALTGMPTGSKSSSSVVERQVIKREKNLEKLQRLMEKRNKERESLWEYIETVADSRMRIILILRCYCLLSWKEIAERIGGPNNAESLRQIFCREYKEF